MNRREAVREAGHTVRAREEKRGWAARSKTRSDRYTLQLNGGLAVFSLGSVGLTGQPCCLITQAGRASGMAKSGFVRKRPESLASLHLLAVLSVAAAIIAAEVLTRLLNAEPSHPRCFAQLSSLHGLAASALRCWQSCSPCWLFTNILRRRSIRLSGSTACLSWRCRGRSLVWFYSR